MSSTAAGSSTPPPGPSGSGASNGTVSSNSSIAMKASAASASTTHYANCVEQMSKQGNFSELAEILPDCRAVLLDRLDSISTLFTLADTFDVQEHSLGLLAVMLSCFEVKHNESEQENVVNRVSQFLINCNGEQIRYAPGLFSKLCHDFTEYMMEKQPKRGILPLLKAINKLQKTETTLTSIHSNVLMLCLQAGFFSQTTIKSLLEKDYTNFSNEALNQDTKHILLFYYYGGMCFAAIKNFRQALYYFEVCVTMPTNAMSHIMLEAYKKYLLVCLIEKGERKSNHGEVTNITLPKYTSHIVTKYVKQICKPYIQLVQAYHTQNKATLENEITANMEEFEESQNVGLVKQVVISQTKFIIKRLTKTFLTLSLNELATRVGLSSPEHAEQLIFQMIQDGIINALICQKEGMVKFESSHSLFNSPAELDLLESNLKKCIELDNQISKLDDEIYLSPNFLKKSALIMSDQVTATTGQPSPASGRAPNDDEATVPGQQRPFTPTSGSAMALNGGPPSHLSSRNDRFRLNY